MFSKEILKEDLIILESLEHQLVNCSALIKEAYIDLIDLKSTDETTRKNKIFIQDLQDQYLDLQKQIFELKERIYLNYTNVLHISAKTTTPNFPHINNFTGYKNNN